MNPPCRHHRPAARAQRGVTMLEVLVTLFIITLFLLASAGVQSSAVKLNKAAQFRTEAVLLATELGERIESNKTEAGNGTYACSSCSLTTSTTACVNTACNSTALATFDLAEWGKRVGDTLPGATANVTWCVTKDAGTPPTTSCLFDAPPSYYAITINWTDRRVNTTYDTTGTTEAFQYTMTKAVFVDPT